MTFSRSSERSRSAFVSALTWAVVLGGIAACDNSRHTAAPLGVAEESLTVNQLITAYDENGVAADARFKGRVLQVDGIVAKIDKDILGQPYLFMVAASRELTGVQAIFSKDRAADLEHVERESWHVVKCRGDGKLMNVLLRNCELIK